MALAGVLIAAFVAVSAVVGAAWIVGHELGEIRGRLTSLAQNYGDLLVLYGHLDDRMREFERHNHPEG